MLAQPFFDVSPIIQSEVLAIPITAMETQSFMLQKGRPILHPEDNPWHEAQKLLIAKTYKQATRILCNESLIIIPGVSHFGHLIGDQLGLLLAAHKINLSQRLNARVLLFNPPGSIVRLLLEMGMEDSLKIITHLAPVRIAIESQAYILKVKSPSEFHLHAGMAMASELVQKKVRSQVAATKSAGNQHGAKIFLTPGQCSRISNISQVRSHLKKNGWEILDPLQVDIFDVLERVAKADSLISENGSILFNCFLARRKPYYVLASTRILKFKHAWHKGGYVYNQFHDGLIRYVLCDASEISNKHPYSDEIIVSEEALSGLASRKDLREVLENPPCLRHNGVAIAGQDFGDGQ